MAEAQLSLWLSPYGADFDRLKDLITTLASETPGCLPFDPHLTLISDDQVPQIPLDQVIKLISDSVKSWKSASSQDDQLELKFQKIQSGELFYQCVLVAVVPSDPLLRLNTLLRESLVPTAEERAGLSKYFPHFSIVYGDLGKDQKESLVERVKHSLTGMDGFKTKEILVVRTSGPSTGWVKLAKISLEDGSSEKTG